MADANTGSSGTIRIDASVSASNAAGNWSDVSWAFYLIERISAPYTSDGYGTDFDVQVNGVVKSSGSFTFDWTPGGLQSQLLASGTTRIYHNADGTPPGVTVRGAIGNTDTSGAGGPTAVVQGVSLPTLKVLPGTPSAAAAVRNSDTQATVSWSQSSASNGQPTSNTVRRKINGGAWSDAVTISPAPSTTIPVAANQKLVYGVKAANSVGSSGWSNDTPAIYTRPAAPSGVTATKVGLDIRIDWISNVAYSEHSHPIEHGVLNTGTGVITWDGAPLVTVASGTLTYLHVAPNAAQVHVYRVWSKSLDVAPLASATVQSNSVQLLTAPNAPTLAQLPAFADKAAAFPVAWTHNAIDTTAQTAYEFSYSTDAGGSWSTTGKVASAAQLRTIAANTYAANDALTVRVRTWGEATTGGSDGTGASPWSPPATVTFKTRPVITIVAPPNAVDHTDAALAVDLGFTQAEGASFVSATIRLYLGVDLLEQISTGTLTDTTLTTRLADQGTYTVTATAIDSNGLVTAEVASTFDVDYTEPVPAGVTITYLPDSGIAQLDLAVPTPSETRVVHQSISGHPGAGTAVSPDWEFSHRQPFNLPHAPSEWRIHIRNRNFLTDTDYVGQWTIDAYVGPSAGIGTAEFSTTPVHAITGASMNTGVEVVSDWFDSPITEDVEYLLSIGAVASGTPNLAMNPNPAWTTASAADAGVLAPAGLYYSTSSGFLDAWIEYRIPATVQTLLTIGHSLNGAGNVDPGAHPWYADQQSWMGQWALALNGINSSLTVGGSWPGHYLDDSPKWTYYQGATPTVVAIWLMSSLIQGGGTLAQCQSELLRLMAKARSLWGDSLRLLIFTEPGRIDLDAPADAVRLQYNDWVRSNPFGAFAIIDADAILTEAGSSPGRLDPAIDADGFHFTLGGHTNVAVAAIAPLSTPVAELEPATSISIDRIIDGVLEPVVVDYDVEAEAFTILDTTPTINGTNVYKVTTRSDDGATTVVTSQLVTREQEWAFMSKGPGLAQIVRFELAPGLQIAPTVDNATFKAAGRKRPIGLYSATSGDLVVAGTGALAEGYGSDPDELEEFLLLPGRGCYRDPSGRRMFGVIKGALALDNAETGAFTYSVTETD